MKSNALIEEADQTRSTTLTPRGWLADAVARRLSTLESGQLAVTLPNGSTITNHQRRDGPRADIRLVRWRALLRLWSGLDRGFADAWIDGDLATSDLSAVLEFGLANEQGLASSLRGIPARSILDRLYHGLKRNSRRGSRRNIAAHYDLGNAFYGHWLDEGMQYSSAIFASDGETLDAAQMRKLQRIASMMDLPERADVLEIGCGWGAVAEHLAQRGHHVTGLTLSNEQAAFARARLAAGGLSGLTSIELRDYRDIGSARYDRIVSIEMLEAVGLAYWPTYFAALRNALRDGGNAVLQVITIDERYFEAYCRNPDFIQLRIFPGGMLPAKMHLEAEARAAGFEIGERICFADSYCRTLAAWRHRFEANWDAIAALGFDDRFRRMWEYYLRYCETGFRHGTIDVGLYKLVKRPDAGAT